MNNFMFPAIFLWLCLMAVPGLRADGLAGASGSKKTLVAYFSHTLTTEKVAREIQKSVPESDILRIEPAAKYPDNYDALLEIARKERDEKARPALRPISLDIKSYDVIFLGYPIWWYEMPMAVYAFLESNDFSGKTIIPFCTHKGSRLSGTEDVIKRLEPGAAVPAGLEISASLALRDDGSEMRKRVSDWLGSLGY